MDGGQVGSVGWSLGRGDRVGAGDSLKIRLYSTARIITLTKIIKQNVAEKAAHPRFLFVSLSVDNSAEGCSTSVDDSAMGTVTWLSSDDMIKGSNATVNWKFVNL